MTPREVAKKIVDDAEMRFITVKPLYDSIDLGERLIQLAIDKAVYEAMNRVFP